MLPKQLRAERTGHVPPGGAQGQHHHRLGRREVCLCADMVDVLYLLRLWPCTLVLEPLCGAVAATRLDLPHAPSPSSLLPPDPPRLATCGSATIQITFEM